MDALFQDVRYGIRQLFRQGGSSAVAILTLALGIGLASALFSVIDAAMLHPLPYPHPEQLVNVSVDDMQLDGRVGHPSPSMEDLRTWQTAGDVFSAVAGAGSAFGGRIVDGPEPERIHVQHFTEDYLSMHGVRPIIGRDFQRADCDPGSPLVALVGYGYWQSHYGGQPDVLGRSVHLDGDVATIIGVLPPWFNATTPLSIPLRIPAAEFSRRGTGRVSVYARLRSGVTTEQAGTRLSSRMNRGSAEVISRLGTITSRYRATIDVLAAAVALIVLIAAVNVAGLLLARGAARQSELGVRASLGANRGRLIRQLLTEAVVLAVPGGVIGVLLAWVSLDTIVANVPLTLPSNAPVTLNGTVLAATTALLMTTALLFGLVPAIRLSRIRIGSVLARTGRQGGSSLSRRGGQILIAAEMALAVVLVAGAGLMIRSFMRISAVDLGFNPYGLVTMQVLPLDRTPASNREYYAALLQRLRTTSRMSSVGLVDNFPLGDETSFSRVSVGGKSTGVTVFQTMPGYFETIEAKLRSGRFPSAADDASGLRAAVINESAARALFPDGAAIGRQFTYVAGDKQPWTVLAVIADLRHGGPLNDRLRNQPQVFLGYEPTESGLSHAMTIVMRPSGDTPGLSDELRQSALAIGPRVLVERIRTGHEWFTDNVLAPRRRTVLLGLLGGLGLTLALVGVFGMTAYAVTRRTTEIGVRMAFGARPGQVVRTMLRDSAVPIAAGTVVGIGAAALATRGIESFLFETAPTDPMTLGLAAVLLAATGCLAALVPALRAANVDPATSLRAD